MITIILLILLQTEGLPTWALIVVAFLTALGVREAVPHVVNRFKTKAEANSISVKTNIEKMTTNSEEFDKMIKRFYDAISEVGKSSDELSKTRQQVASLAGDLYIFQQKERLWDKEKSILEAAIKSDSERLTERDKTIVELREQLQDIQNARIIKR